MMMYALKIKEIYNELIAFTEDIAPYLSDELQISHREYIKLRRAAEYKYFCYFIEEDFAFYLTK